MGIPGGWELVIIVAVLMLVFGPRMIPKIVKGMGRSFVETKKAVKDLSKDIKDIEENLKDG